MSAARLPGSSSSYKLPPPPKPTAKLTAANSGPMLYRARPSGLVLQQRDSTRDDRARTVDDYAAVLAGHAIKFDEPTAIYGEGEPFVERFAPGAFRRTLSNRTDREAVRALFQHGRDAIGDRPLGPFLELAEDGRRGLFFRVGLLAGASYVAELLPALRAGLMGSSIRFRAVKQTWDTRPRPSAFNPDGLPERTVREARLYEVSAVTFPAYAGATAQLENAGGRADTVSLTEYFRRSPAEPRPSTPYLPKSPTWRLPE